MKKSIPNEILLPEVARLIKEAYSNHHRAGQQHESFLSGPP